MEYIIYYDIANRITCDGMINLLKSIFEKLYLKHRLVKIENSQIFEHRLIDLCKVLKDYFLQHPLDEQDELYIYYWSDIEIGMWRVKKKGRLNAKWERNDLLCIDDSLGSRLGIITNDISH